jgi:hypothetical protein
MPNPIRPSFGEVIDETWGDLVADHVVRRYVNAAERDADLAGLTAAELAGQVVVLVPGPAGTPPQIQLHDGTGWVTEPRVAAGFDGYSVVTTDTWGNWSVALPPGAKAGGAVANGSQENLAFVMVRHLANWPAGSNSIGFRAWAPDGSNPANTTIGATWLATYITV